MTDNPESKSKQIEKRNKYLPYNLPNIVTADREPHIWSIWNWKNTNNNMNETEK